MNLKYSTIQVLRVRAEGVTEGVRSRVRVRAEGVTQGAMSRVRVRAKEISN